MANREMNPLGRSAAPQSFSLRSARWRYALVAVVLAVAAVYAVALHYLLPRDGVPATGQRLLALGFAALVMLGYTLATRTKGTSADALRHARHGPAIESGTPGRGRFGARPERLRIPGLGEVSRRLIYGVAVVTIAGGWWLTPWAPVRVRPTNLGDLTGDLADDLVAVMLVLPDDHTAVVAPPQAPSRLWDQTRWVRDDSAAYPLAMRCLAQGEFALAGSHLSRAGEMHELEPLPLAVLTAQVEMYAGHFAKAVGAYDEALRLAPDDPMLLCQSAAARIQAGEFDLAYRGLNKAAWLCRQPPASSGHAKAACLHLQGILAMARGKNFNEAVALVEDRSDASWKALGENHVLAVANLNNLAALYLLRANYSGARAQFDSSLAMATTTLGAADPRVATIQTNLALLAYCQGQYARAAELLDQPVRAADVHWMVRLWRWCFGEPARTANAAALPDHPARIAELNLRAVILRAQGRRAVGDDDPALAALQRAQTIAQKSLAHGHPLAAVVADNLAAVYVDHAQYAKALQVATDAADWTEKRWGPSHPFLAGPLGRLAAVCTLRGAYADAEAFCRRAKTIAEQLGDQHPVLAGVLLARGRLEIARETRAAQDSLEGSRKIYEEAYDPKHPLVAQPLAELASLQTSPKTCPDGINDFSQAIELVENSAGRQHPDIARWLQGKAVLYIRQGELADAKDCLDRALDIQVEFLEPNHPDRAATLTTYADLLSKMTPPDDARADEMKSQADEILKHRQDDQ